MNALESLSDTKEGERSALVATLGMPLQLERTRHIPASVRRAVWLRDQGQCQYRDPKTGRRCLSRFKIQIDHRIPFAKSGASDAGNCRLTCAAHNAYLALRAYGPQKMRSYRQ